MHITQNCKKTVSLPGSLAEVDGDWTAGSNNCCSSALVELPCISINSAFVELPCFSSICHRIQGKEITKHLHVLGTQTVIEWFVSTIKLINSTIWVILKLRHVYV